MINLIAADDIEEGTSRGLEVNNHYLFVVKRTAIVSCTGINVLTWEPPWSGRKTVSWMQTGRSFSALHMAHCFASKTGTAWPAHAGANPCKQFHFPWLMA